MDNKIFHINTSESLFYQFSPFSNFPQKLIFAKKILGIRENKSARKIQFLPTTKNKVIPVKFPQPNDPNLNQMEVSDDEEEYELALVTEDGKAF